MRKSRLCDESGGWRILMNYGNGLLVGGRAEALCESRTPGEDG